MKLLVIDTSSTLCCVALQNDGQIFEKTVATPQQHAQQILPLVDMLLHEAGMTLQQLDAIGFSAGPGSFTGVRLAATVTQAIAYVMNIPVISLSSLQVLAQSANLKYGAKLIAVAVDARMQDIYWGIYQADAQGIMRPLIADMLCRPDALVIPETLRHQEMLCIGDAWRAYEDILVKIFSETSKDSHEIFPAAESLILLTEVAFQAGEVTDAANAQPRYLRDESAWKKWSGG